MPALEQEFTLYIVIRADLGMSAGKCAAQAAHATAASSAHEIPDCRKIILAAPNAATIERLAHLPGAGPIIRDAGRTEIAGGTITALALGPMAPNDRPPQLKRLKPL